MLSIRKIGSTLTIMALPFLLCNCAVNPVTGKRELMLMSEQEEIQIGRRYHPQILQQYGQVDNPELSAYVAATGRKLAELSHRNELIFRFTVLDSPQVNAFALPGGYIYIARGLIAYLNSEAELAGVLGHEIGHVTARHGAQRQTAGTIATILSTAVAYKTNSRTYTDLSQLLGGVLISGYGREQELQADQLGAEYLARSGYDPEHMLNVITVLKNQELFSKQRAKTEGEQEQTYHGLFATHPSNDKRLQQIINTVKQNNTNPTQDENRSEFLEKISGMVFGHNTKQGLIRNNNFYHPEMDFTFSFDKNWKIKNLPNKVILTAPPQEALLQLTVTDLNKKQKPGEYLRLTLGKKINTPTEHKIGGFDAATAIGSAQLTVGSRPARYTAIFKDQQIYLFVAVAIAADKFNSYKPSFESLIASFRKMTTAELNTIKPLKITLYKVKQGDSYGKLAKKSPLSQYAEQQLRLINGHYPDGELTPGTTIKLIQ